VRPGIIAIAGAVVFGQIASARPPNVVIFYADDMGIGDAGCYGCTDIKTPNIDALAAAGVRFTNYYSAAPICSPSRAALLTGRYPIRAGVPGNVSSQPGAVGLPADEVTIAELARTRGYATAIVGKWHLGFTRETEPNGQGFDAFFGHHAGCIDYYSHWFYWEDPPHHDLYRNRDEVYEEGRYMTDLIVREVTQFIDDHKDSPFLLYIPFNAPHYPTQAPERLRKMYAHLPEPRRLYAPLVAGLDEAIGRIMDRVRKAGIEKDTLVFFASDNGASVEARNNYGGGSSGPYRGFKFSLFEGGIRMPAIVSRPGTVPAGETRGQVVVGMDVFATIAEAIGAELPAGRKIDGQSWIPLLKDCNAPGHATLFWMQGGQKAVRRGKWKLVCNGLAEEPGPKRDRRARAATVFLANLEADPGETKNLKDQHPEIVAELTKLHDEWRADVERPAQR
jgi:arylsulfatase A